MPAVFAFGRSVEGRDLIAHRFGDGDKRLLLIGGIHAGYEANTVRLLDTLREHFASNPADVLPGVTLLLIPSMNPDGLTYGRQLRGRFNSNNVDLNRNWGCGWSPDARFQVYDVNAGTGPFSEPETQAVGALIQQTRPDAVLFYHAAAFGVYAGGCDGRSVSLELSRVYGDAASYPAGQAFSNYTLTGTASAWVDGLGIPAAAVELATSTETELVRNLRGVLAVQRWLLE